MRSAIARTLWLGLLLTPALVGLSNGDQGKAPPDPLEPLVKQLGSDVFVKRLDARKKLIALGETAIPALRQAAASHPDVEIRRRADELIRAILPPRRKSKSTGLEMALIEGGEFVMGSPAGERNRRPDEPQHNVRIKDRFYLGVFEVTQEEFQKLMGNNPSWFASTGQGKDSVRDLDTRRFPVENLTWFEAVDFCNRLSGLDGYPPYYKITNPKTVGSRLRNANVTILGGSGYRLPTEAEWEFACRAMSETPYHFGRANSGREANLKPSSTAGGYGGGPAWPALNRTTKVGSYPANSHGLHDMHGNAAEWCWDHYDKDYYTNSPKTDPRGPSKGEHRVNRGGSWLVLEGSCRSASRFMQVPGEGNYSVGFRVARNP